MKFGIMLWDEENCLDVHITGVHIIEVVTVCNRDVPQRAVGLNHLTLKRLEFSSGTFF